jgi:hypothetical protein
MKTRTKTLAALLGVALVTASLAGGSAGAAKRKKKAKSGPKVVAKDATGDWGADPQLAPLADALGQDLVSATIAMKDAKTVNFIIKVNSLPPTGGVPEVSRYWWDFAVGKNLFELDGKYTNYSRGACDPTSGQCPPPRDPGLQPFLLRGDCAPDATANNITVCKEKAIVQASFDPAKGTITIPVALKLLKAKPGTKISPTASFATVGGPITAAPAAFVTNASMPLDAMTPTGTFVIPKK